MTEESLLAAALQKPTAAERDTYLDQVCAGDPARRRRLEALVQARAGSGNVFGPARGRPASTAAGRSRSTAGGRLGSRIIALCGRHRTAIGMTAAFAARILTAAAVGAWPKGRATQARQSEPEAAAVLDFLVDRVFTARQPVRTEGNPVRELTLREAVDAAEREVAASFADRPADEAALREVLGESYFLQGDWSEALRQDARAQAIRGETHASRP
jgi:hypothetical protein